MLNGLTQVQPSELKEYVDNYPRPLEIDVAQMYEPPLKTWNDFSNGKVWPQSVVAAEVIGETCWIGATK